MHPEMTTVPCAIVRGGTSKGIFLLEQDLPKNQRKRDRLILSIFGSPDIRQIDGLGGADVLTSKLAIVGPPTVEDADVDYTFGQVSMEEALVDYGGNCGNISSAVGGFAIDMGLVDPVEPVTTVRIHMTNTHRILIAHVPVKDGRARVTGDYAIDGVPGTGAKITMDWSDGVGGTTGQLLPTGNPVDTVEVGDTSYTVSVVDAGNVVVFVRAVDLGLTGTETPAQIEGNRPLMNLIEEIRGKICVRLGMVSSWEEAAHITPYQPFLALVSKAATHDCFNGVHVDKAEVDVVSRLLFMLHTHKAYAISATVCTGAAARIPGTVVHTLLSREAHQSPVVRIGHASGTVSVEATAQGAEDGQVRLTHLLVHRTARMIMKGNVYIHR